MEARLARDRLAGLVGLHPREIGGLAADIAAFLSARFESVEQALEAARKDHLTEALIRSAGVSRLTAELARCQRSGDSLCLLFIDIDGMKAVNDRYGHAAGDRALKMLGGVLAGELRPYDVVIRWGGDEFLVGLPGCDLEQARGIGARIARDYQERTHLGIALGCAGSAAGEIGLDELIAAADADMYDAKRGAAPQTGPGGQLA